MLSRWLAWWRGGRASTARAREQFAAALPGLQGRFFAAASAGGKPRGLVWKAIDWEPGFALARERATGRLAALVGVGVSFVAEEGSDMEGLPAVGLVRNASAVFFYHRGEWHTTGRVIFNLNPDEAIAHFANGYEPV